MTAYAASAAAKLTIVPSSTYQVRIARVEAFGNISGGGGALSYSVNVYPGNAASSGTTITPLPMRAGAPASTASVKSGATISGTNTLMHSEVQGSNDTTVYILLNSNYTFPFDLILSSGSTFAVTPSSAGTTVIVYYEELRLAWAG